MNRSGLARLARAYWGVSKWNSSRRRVYDCHGSGGLSCVSKMTGCTNLMSVNAFVELPVPEAAVAQMIPGADMAGSSGDELASLAGSMKAPIIHQR